MQPNAWDVSQEVQDQKTVGLWKRKKRIGAIDIGAIELLSSCLELVRSQVI